MDDVDDHCSIAWLIDNTGLFNILLIILGMIFSPIVHELGHFLAIKKFDRKLKYTRNGFRLIWEIDSWSLAKQSGIYFAIACVIMFPISYFANWMPHSTGGILSYVGIFVAIFLAAWIAQYSVWKRKIKKMNEGIKDNNDMN